MMNILRQGDVLLVEIEKLPPNLTSADKTLARGEVTGHSHRFESACVYAFEDEKNTKYLEVSDYAPLLHEEHKSIVVPPGRYLVIRQRELDLQEEVQRVSD